MSEIERLRSALDNSQSLLAMFMLLGVDEDGLGIMPAVWKSEDLSKLLTEQLLENRQALSLPSQEHQT